MVLLFMYIMYVPIHPHIQDNNGEKGIKKEGRPGVG